MSYVSKIIFPLFFLRQRLSLIVSAVERVSDVDTWAYYLIRIIMFIKMLLVIVVVCAALALAHIHDLRKLDDYTFDRYNEDYRLGLKKGT